MLNKNTTKNIKIYPSMKPQIAPNILLGIPKIMVALTNLLKTPVIFIIMPTIIDNINKVEGLEVQYYEIVDGDSLVSLENWEDSESVVGCITVFCGKRPVRLIDNVRYK